MTVVAAGIALILVIIGVRSVIVVPPASAYVVERLGRYHRTLSSGAHVLVPVLDRAAHRYSLLPKENELTDVAITLDNMPITVKSTLAWRIIVPEKAAYGAADLTNFITGLARLHQRHWISERRWSDVRETTRELQQAVLRSTDAAAATAGVHIVAFAVREIAHLPNAEAKNGRM